MTQRRGRPAAAPGVLVSATLLLLALVGMSASSAADGPGLPAGPRLPVHSSDGRPGPTVAPAPSWRLGTPVVSNEVSYRVAPGLRFRRWDRTDARGTARLYLLRANLARPGLSLQYAGLRHVSDRAELTKVLARDGAVAGVNADFFDIADTGAPLGVGVDEGRVLHGQGSGWITSFVVSGKADARIGTEPVSGEVVGRPAVHLTDLNSPYVRQNGIGVFTRRWGAAPGYAVTDGADPAEVRQVVVRNGRVVSNSGHVATGTAIRGRLLLGREGGADDLRTLLPVGTPVRLRFHAEGSPRVAVSGSEVLASGGRALDVDDTELHPRTAVGIDTDTGRVLLLVVDGRQESSSGYTLRQLADVMVSLGADEVLNLDGGGSSTMVTKQPSGDVGVVNSPSDGGQRPVPEGLELVYTPPAG
jgi:hypothetical protein